MTLTNYWWLLIWLVLAGGLLAIAVPKKPVQILGKTEYRWSWGAALILAFPYVIWAGNRIGFGDTEVYRSTFKIIPALGDGLITYLSEHEKDQGYVVLASVIKTLIGSNDKPFFFFIAVFQMFCIIYFFRKYSTSFLLSVFMFVISTDYLSWMFNGMRQFIAVCMILLCFGLLLRKKYVLTILVILYQMCFEDGRVHYFHNTGLLVQQDKITALKELLSGSRIEPGLCNKLFHKTLFRSLLHGEAVPLDIKINEDLLMNYMLFFAAEQTVFEDWCPYHYIVRSASASRAKLNPHKIYDPIKVKEIIRQSAPAELHDAAQQAYINTCINMYHALLMEGAEYKDDLRMVHELLVKEADDFSLLWKKRELMANMIVHTPALYRPIYAVYSRFFQKKIYS